MIILWAGRHQRAPWQALCDDYRQRIEHEVTVEERWIKARGSSEDPKRRQLEATAMLEALPDPCWTLALDASGRRMDSPAFAAELKRIREEWPHPVAFLIGSDLGLDPGVLRAARQRLSLGPMVFGHELARLVLYEQIYRALAISRGGKYHRG